MQNSSSQNAISRIVKFVMLSSSDNSQILKNGNKNQRYFIFGKLKFLLFVKLHKGAYSNEQSLNFVIPIIVILFLGVIYIMTQKGRFRIC